MNITLLHLLLSLLFLAVPAYVFWRLDGRLLRQTAKVVARTAVVLLVLAVCLHYVFLWNLGWLNVVWVLVSGGLATALYCRKRWLSVPVYLSSTLCSLAVGLLVLLLTTQHTSLLTAHLFIPVMAVLQADALFVCRRGLSLYALYRRRHASLGEYLQGNGATGMQVQQPFVAQTVRRAFSPVLKQLLLAGAVFVPSLLVGLLLVGIAPYQAMGFLAVLTLGAVCCTLLALLLTLYIYNQLKK